MTEQELIAEAKARANIATQKMNEQFHNESVNCTVNVNELPAAFIESVRTGLSFVKVSLNEVQQIEERVESWHQTYK